MNECVEWMLVVLVQTLCKNCLLSYGWVCRRWVSAGWSMEPDIWGAWARLLQMLALPAIQMKVQKFVYIVDWMCHNWWLFSPWKRTWTQCGISWGEEWGNRSRVCRSYNPIIRCCQCSNELSCTIIPRRDFGWN